MKRLGMCRSPVVFTASVGLMLSAAATTLAAQSSAKSASAVPQVSIRGATGLRSLINDAGVAVTVDRDAYVTVFALAPGKREAPLAVLSPRAPGSSSRLEGGRRYRTLPLRSPQLLRLVSAGTPQVIVAFSSTVQPNLEAFRDGTRWATDLVLTDSMAVGTAQLVRALAQLLYGDETFSETLGGRSTFRAVVQPLSEGAPLNRYSGFPSTSECLTDVMRVSFSADFAQNYGNSGELRPLNGNGGGCSDYTIDWVAPAPTALYGRTPAASGTASSPSASVAGTGTP